MTKVLGHNKVETPKEKRDGFGFLGDAQSNSPLKKKFHLPPFDVIDTRTGDWQNRKRVWKSLGIRSEEGRGDSLLYNTNTFFKDAEKYGKAWAERALTETSIFDPVLCELCYTWFCPVGGRILDPFAGGSVRGIVATHMGLPYVGIDLSKTQVEANVKQAKTVGGLQPQWVVGNSLRLHKLVEGEFDMMFTCPPYHDLEKYSKDPEDLSNVTYEEFVVMIGTIASRVEKVLKNNRFACVVIQDVRGPDGNMRGMIVDFINAFRATGMKLYNEAKIVQMVGTACLRASRQFNAGRKLVKTHGTLLVFVKGAGPKVGKEGGLWTA